MDREYINWHLIFLFMMQRWRLKKKDIASMLNYDASKLSRGDLQFDPKLAYAKLFKLTATRKAEKIDSLASRCGENESLLLEALEIFLRKSKCITDADFIQASVKSQKRYEDIIPELLKRANMLSPITKDSVKKECSKSAPSPSEQEPPASVADGDATPVSDKTGDTSLNTEVPVTLDETVLPDISNEQEPLVPAADHENESNDQEANETETQPERMVDVFDQSYNDYAVESFIDSDPTTDRIYDMIHFIGHIREQGKMDCLDKNEEIYQGIVSFVDILQEYLSFLKRSSGNLDFFPDNYTPPNSDNKEFSEGLNRYREQLKSLYLPIKVEVEKQRDEKDEQRRAAGKEAWDKSTQKGSL